MPLTIRGNLATQWQGFNGNVSAPMYSFSSAPGSGVYHAGAGNIGVSVNGTSSFVASNTGITVQGNVSGAYILGNGAALTNINASNISSGTLSVARGGTGVTTSTGTGSVVLNTNPELSILKVNGGIAGNVLFPGNNNGIVYTIFHHRSDGYDFLVPSVYLDSDAWYTAVSAVIGKGYMLITGFSSQLLFKIVNAYAFSAGYYAIVLRDAFTGVKPIPSVNTIYQVQVFGGDGALTANSIIASGVTVQGHTIGVGGNVSAVTNLAVGSGTLQNNTTGGFNTACGRSALQNNTTGSQNTACGVNALQQNTTGSYNTACGLGTLQLNSTGIYNMACGMQALQLNTTGSQNTACGQNALGSNTTGSLNTACGQGALFNNTTGSFNTACGQAALQNNTTGSENVSCGTNALQLNTTGAQNTACGAAAILFNTTGSHNTACGYTAMLFNTTGSFNTACGRTALGNNTTGNYNTACGGYALNYNIAGTGFNYANCSGLGYDTRCSADNQVQVGGSETTAYVYGTVQNRSDVRDKADVRDTVLGLDFIEKLRPVDYKWDMRDDYFTKHFVVTKIDISGDDDDLQDGQYDIFIGDIKIGSVTYPSKDVLLDEDITFTEKQENAEVAGHPEIRVTLQTSEKLVPIPKDGSKKRTRYHHGVIAQDVKDVLDDLQIDFGGYQWHSVSGGNDVYSIGYDEFIGPLIKAVQQLSARVVALENP